MRFIGMRQIFRTLLPASIFLGIGAGCATIAMGDPTPTKLPSQLSKQTVGKPSAKTASLYLASGCFWCIESQFEMLKGVKEVVSGYAGAKGSQPSYESVLGGSTGFAEAVEVQYDPAVISADNLLRIFFVSHDPTQLNRQGPDVGTQYRSAIFFRNDAEKKRAATILDEVSKEKIFPNKIVTTIEPLIKFWRAEEYHQDYYAKFEKASDAERSKMNAGYCSYVVSPKIEAFKQKFAHLLK